VTPVALTDDPAIIIVGGGAIALSTAQELCTLRGHHVVVLWRRDADLARAVEAIGAAYIAAARPDSSEALDRAGVRGAITILALSPDDQLNLHAALLARDANPGIRIVLRQFNRTLGHKIEQNLPNCSVLSLARHSAATYAVAALDPYCLRGLQFPQPNGPLTGFATRIAEDCAVEGHTVAQAERAIGARIVAIDGATDFSPEAVLSDGAELVVFDKVARLEHSVPRRPVIRQYSAAGRRLRRLLSRGWRQVPRPNPILARLAVATLTVLALGAVYFHSVFGSGWLDAVYFVVTTMTTTGYGDLTPDRGKPSEIIAALLLMLAGIILTGLFIAFGASLLTRIYWIKLQGLRPVHRRGHIVVCGAGSIGTEVIDLLLALSKQLVVIELNPDTNIVERAREQDFDLLTGDASRDTTLDLCNLDAAHSLIALTNVDTLNLEIALGARARNPTMPIVFRIAEATFAASIARHFEFETTYSAAALAAPAFVGLSRFPGSRGRVSFGGQDFAIAELGGEEPPVTLPPEVISTALGSAIPIAVSRGDSFEIIHDFGSLRPDDRTLVLIPVAPFKEVRDAFPIATPALQNT
jgi:Trk K+ transport system NAD-binding subunit